MTYVDAVVTQVEPAPAPPTSVPGACVVEHASIVTAYRDGEWAKCIHCGDRVEARMISGQGATGDPCCPGRGPLSPRQQITLRYWQHVWRVRHSD